MRSWSNFVAEKDEGQGSGTPAQNPVSEPGGQAGGEGGTPSATGQRGTAAGGNQSTDQDLYDRGFDKGTRAGKRELYESIEKEHGVSFKDLVAQWKEAREAVGKAEQKENAELVKLQRVAAGHEQTVQQLREQNQALAVELGRYRITLPIKEAVAKLAPPKPEYAAVLEREIASRVKLDDDGELTVLTKDGKPNHKATLDTLAKEVAEALPDLVTPPRTGVGVTPHAAAVTRSQPQQAGKELPVEERVSALQKLGW